ncbi:hypothetical protein F66182_1281 [Fusarium sp. NRRL 66182]|nr:hypothetical protein F66182_1281 [Fusarium sp. NRRL 66182]
MTSCRAHKQVSEPARERESFKFVPLLSLHACIYGASLLNDITDSPSEGVSFDQNTPMDHTDVSNKQPPSSRDTVLASIAQLGLWRTGTDRALISLFDRNHQYIVAETTKRSPLSPGPIRPKNDHGELWLYPGTFPRQLSVCDRALMAQTKNSPTSDEELPLTLIPDLTADARLSKIPHPLAECPARFYAAVPIRAPNGIDIGVYCVVDPQPKAADDWSNSDTHALREISSNIMDYLQSKSVGDAYRRSVRMTRGIGSFVEKESTMAGWRAAPSSPAFHDDASREGALNSEQQALQRFRGLGLQKTSPIHAPTQPNIASETTVIDSGGTGDADTASTTSPSTSVQESDANLKERAMAKIFSRAANLIREGIEIEGVVFLDANSEASATDAMLQQDDTPSGPESSSSSDEATYQTHDLEESSWCGVLGFATSASSSINLDVSSNLHAVPTRLLAALLRRYPTGKIFNFDEDGGLLSCGSSEEDLSNPILKQDLDAETLAKTMPHSKQRPWSRASEGPLIAAIFPGSRSVAFVPVWDPKRDRWLAGGFAYTLTPTRAFTVQGELSYLRAFGMLAMSKAQRLEAFLSTRHSQMCSGLYLTNFGNLLRTLETCGRTLSETIDHLLYFSKVNQATVHRKRERRARKRSVVSDAAATIAASVATSSVRLDALVEEVMDSVFAGHFYRREVVVGAWQANNRSQHPDVEDAQSPGSRDLTGRQPQKSTEYEVPLGHEDQVAIFLDIDPYVPYRFHVAAGALRRVVMNLFGNALKYTRNGTITVSLSQKSLSSNNVDSNKCVVRISVTDTGQGISPDFLRNDLFKPFSQENHLSHGTGLGLSLVKKIVASMGGKISIESKANVGTTATVTLPLTRTSDVDEGGGEQGLEKNEVDEETKRLKGLRVRLIGFPSEDEIESKTGRGIPMYAMRTMCHRWLEMDVVCEDSYQDVAPDLVLCNEMAIKDPVLSSEELIRSPVVVVCANAMTAHRRSSENKTFKEQRVYEFVSQPIGPHKLARILHIAFRRWGDLQASSPAVPTKADGDPLNHGPNETKRRSTGNNIGVDVSEDKATPPGLGLGSMRRDHSPHSSHEKQQQQEVQQEVQASTNGPKSFLLVDDNPINLSVLCAYMKKLGSKYITAADGLEALERFQENPNLFSCILMDISMPRMDGIEATKRIRAFEHDKDCEPVAIFALTGLASASAQQDAYASGVDVFLSKPVKLKELSTILREKSLA